MLPAIVNGLMSSLRAPRRGANNPLAQLLQLLMRLVRSLGSNANNTNYPMSGQANFGRANNPSGNKSLGSFLGSNNVSNGQVPSGNALGRQIAADASRTRDQKGYCFRAVARTLSKYGVRLSGRSAYMAADQMAKSPKFREIRVSRDQLRSLPPGAVVVWNRGPGLPHGHISISLGNGQEASWKNRPQLMLKTSFRVFVPR